MRINVIQLNHALVNAKKPEREGEVYFLATANRLEVLNKKLEDGDKEAKNLTIQKIKLVAIQLCDKNSCWLEWEIEI